jgi:hypothetical protein
VHFGGEDERRGEGRRGEERRGETDGMAFGILTALCMRASSSTPVFPTLASSK